MVPSVYTNHLCRLPRSWFPSHRKNSILHSQGLSTTWFPCYCIQLSKRLFHGDGFWHEACFLEILAEHTWHCGWNWTSQTRDMYKHPLLQKIQCTPTLKMLWLWNFALAGQYSSEVGPSIFCYVNLGQILNLFSHIMQIDNKLSQNYIFGNSGCMHVCTGDIAGYAGGQWLACTHASVTGDCLLV